MALGAGIARRLTSVGSARRARLSGLPEHDANEGDGPRGCWRTARSPSEAGSGWVTRAFHTKSRSGDNEGLVNPASA